MTESIKALIVDDSAVMRKIMITALSAAGVTDTDEVADGVQALEAVNAQAYGLVLMDWNMPNMTGIDAVRAIRARGNAVPIIMVTTESERERILEAIKAGANDYVMKPFTKQELADSVQLVLKRSRTSVDMLRHGGASRAH